MMMMLRFCIDPNRAYSIVIPVNAFVELPELRDAKIRTVCVSLSLSLALSIFSSLIIQV